MRKLLLTCKGVFVQRDDVPNLLSKKYIEHSKSTGTCTYRLGLDILFDILAQ